MRHRKSGRKLGRDAAHRRAMLSNLATSLLEHERVQTTVPRAKELRSFAEPLITAAKEDTLSARRRVARTIRDKDVLRKLFAQVGPRFAERPGGYTRIYRIGPRRGDAAEMAVIELVDRSEAGPAAGEQGAGGGSGRRLVERDDSESTPESNPSDDEKS